MGYVSGEHFDLALVECDSYALKRSQNVLHAAEIIDVLNKYIPTIAYGNYCYIMKRNFGNARHLYAAEPIKLFFDKYIQVLVEKRRLDLLLTKWMKKKKL